MVSATLDPRTELDIEHDMVGVIDVGSNSVRLVVFEGRPRGRLPIFNEKVLCGLGRRLDQTGRLDRPSRCRWHNSKIGDSRAVLNSSAALNERRRLGGTYDYFPCCGSYRFKEPSTIAAISSSPNWTNEA